MVQTVRQRHIGTEILSAGNKLIVNQRRRDIVRASRKCELITRTPQSARLSLANYIADQLGSLPGTDAELCHLAHSLVCLTPVADKL